LFNEWFQFEIEDEIIKLFWNKKKMV